MAYRRSWPNEMHRTPEKAASAASAHKRMGKYGAQNRSKEELGTNRLDDRSVERLLFGTSMNTITSSDGTTIAYDVTGSGPTAVIVDGALTTRSSGSKPELVKFLSQHLTVYNYDRRGTRHFGLSNELALTDCDT
jgi:hypothetical protein